MATKSATAEPPRGGRSHPFASTSGAHPALAHPRTAVHPRPVAHRNKAAVSRTVRREKSRWRLSFRARLLLILAMFLVMAVVAFAAHDWLVGLGEWGYLGAFVINAVSSSVVVLPAPGLPVLLIMAQRYDPVLLGIAAGLGGALGSFTAYLVGRLGSRAVRSSRFHKLMYRAMRHCGGVILFFFSLIPFLPMDIGGLMAGATKYPVRSYFLYVSAASVTKMIAVFYLSAVYVDVVRDWIGTNAPSFMWVANMLGS